MPSGNSLAFKDAFVFPLILAAVMYGIILRQIIRYHANFRADLRLITLWTYAIGTLVTFGMVLDVYNTWEYTTAISINWFTERITLPAGGYCQGITMALVQLFFIVSIWNIRRRVYPRSRITKPLCLLYFSIAMSTCATHTASFSVLYSYPPEKASNIMAKLLRYKIIMDTTLDLFITYTLIRLLKENRVNSSSRSFKFVMELQDDSRLRRLLIYIMSRGIFLAVAQTAFLICDMVLVNGPTAIGVATTILMPQIYALSMLSIVTNREPRRTKRPVLPPRSGDEPLAGVIENIVASMDTSSVFGLE